MKIRHALAVLSALAFANVANAGSKTYKIVPGDSKVTFVLTSSLNDIKGESTELTGAIEFDPASRAASSILAEVPVETLKTGIDRRDRHMRSEEFLDAVHYPTAKFISASLEPKGEPVKPGETMTFVYKGSLEIHGKRVPIEGEATATLTEDGKTIEGDARFPVHLPNYEIPVPAFLGI
ncbi:MAG: YceI family protein, partial [Myxococcales bacterium]|nr:YceI family protein [Myxococcales bacterium]